MIPGRARFSIAGPSKGPDCNPNFPRAVHDDVYDHVHEHDNDNGTVGVVVDVLVLVDVDGFSKQRGETHFRKCQTIAASPAGPVDL
jgi:hypothetical protein